MKAGRPLRVLVVDDEKPARELLASFLREDPELELVAICGHGEEALAVLAQQAVDVLFLDIQMPELGGFDVLRRLDPGRMPRVVFVTAFDEYAVDAFEVRALDYLLKPFPRQRLQETLRRAKLEFQTRAWWQQTRRVAAWIREVGSQEGGLYTRQFQVQTGTRLLVLRCEEISHIESADHYTRLWSGGASHLLLRSLSAVEQELDPARFVRIHRTKIVNLAHVAAVRAESGTYRVELTDGSRHDVSRSRREKVAVLLYGRRGIAPGSAS